MPKNPKSVSFLASALVAQGALSGAGDVDVDFYAMRLQVAPELVRAALDELVEGRLLKVEDRWRCAECDAQTTTANTVCVDCGAQRTQNEQEVRAFVRARVEPQRDPAAVFLIHGMNTLGAWQESGVWKIQLLYGYALPMFAFKYGLDRMSPLTQRSQQRRMEQLGDALRRAQGDLQRAGRSQRCDVIAHSFGALIFSQLLASESFEELSFGRVVLCGSIVPQEFPWTTFVESGRIEAVLNHRAGRDLWVRIAPWFFPRVGSSGARGFNDQTGVDDHVSATFGHCDYFLESHFDGVIRQVWTPFLNAHASKPASTEKSLGDRLTEHTDRRYWIGRGLLLSLAAVCFVLLLKLASVAGAIATNALSRIGM